MRKSKFRKSHLRKSQHLLAPKLLNLPTKEYKKFPLGLPRAVYADSVQSNSPFLPKHGLNYHLLRGVYLLVRILFIV